MSFSGEVKEELAGIVPGPRHCRIAEAAAFVRFIGVMEENEDQAPSLMGFRTDRTGVATLLFTLFQRTYNIGLVIGETEGKRRPRGPALSVRMPDGVSSEEVLQSISHGSMLQMECCRNAFLRGAFLSAGSVSDPEKSYHLEIVCPDAGTAGIVRDTMKRQGLDAKVVIRKKDHVVYLKEGDQIVELLGMMGASISFLNVENVRVMKEMRSSVNRQVNCETANLNKIIVSAYRQIEDICYIRDHVGFGELPDALREMAEVRLAYPDVPLAELGRYLNPVIGKSGVNHRLRKLSSIADKKRREAEGFSGGGLL